MQATLPFGTTIQGTSAHLYLLGNANGMVVGVSDLGANLVTCRVPDGHGHAPDVLLGHDGAAGYLDDVWNMGAVVGRCANRIANARFDLQGSSYTLAANSGPHNLHSGPHRWSDRLWKVVGQKEHAITFELTSRKGDQGFPGAVQAHVHYELDEDNRLSICYDATTSEATIINLTNHAYWNLNGHAAGNVLKHQLQLDADHYTPLDDHIPTGEIVPVADTPYDFRELRTLDACLDQLPGGYDDNFCLDNGGKLTRAAHLVGDISGITMTVLTDAPGIQVFTADFFGAERAKDGARYGAFAGVALETQYYPDAIHHKNFPQPVFTPHRPYRSKTVFAFGTTA